MNKIKITMTEAELRALAWDEDSNPETYHVERDDEVEGKLCVVSDGEADAYYGASATLPDGRALTVCEDWSGERSIYIDGQDAEILGADERGVELDWPEITGYRCAAPITDDDTYAARADAVRRFVRAFFAAGGVAYRDDGDYDNVYRVYLCGGASVCPDGLCSLPSGVDRAALRKLSECDAASAVRFALVGNGRDYYKTATVCLLDAYGYGCEVVSEYGDTDATDLDMTFGAAEAMADQEITDGARQVRIIEAHRYYVCESATWHDNYPRTVGVYNNLRAEGVANG